MRFLTDENVRKSVCDLLQERGHDAVSVVAQSPSIRDEVVLKLAYDEERILITNDKDFGELVFYRGHPTHGVVLMRLQDEHRESVRSHLNALLDNYSEKLLGHFVVVSDHQVRFHKL